jgi:hypothetical protein
LGSEAFENVDGVELAEAHPCSAFPGEADVGHLWGGEHPVLVEEAAQDPVPSGEPTEDGQQPGIEVAPPSTATGRADA